MNITETLQQMIDQLKKTGDPELRNKLISQLKTARYLSELMDIKTGQRFEQQVKAGGGTPPVEAANICTCPMGGSAGVISRLCPIHGDHALV